MMGFAVLLVIFLFLFIIYLYKFSKKRPENFPPGPPRLPFWGSYWFLLKENYEFSFLAMQTLAKRYKTDILGFFLGDVPTITILSYDLCKEVLVRDEFIGRNDTPVVRVRSLGELKGIFFVDGPFWKEQRRFSLRHMRDYGFGRRSDVLEDFTSDEIKRVIEFLNNDPKEEDMDICKGRGHVLLPDALYGPLLNSILLVLSSTRFDDYKRLRICAKDVHAFLSSIDATGGAISMTPWLRFFAPEFFKFNQALNSNIHLREFVKELLDEHLKTFSDDHHRDFIDEFISETYKEGYELDYNQLLMITLDYMFPSPVAIGNTINFLLIYLINAPLIQNKIQEELDTVVGRGRLPNLDDRKNLPYLEASLREVIRIFPLTPLSVARRCVKDTMLGGYFIPEGTAVLPCLWSAHRDEKYFDNPEEFRPERFLDSEGNLMKKDYTIGFGAGKRLCAGETFARHTLFLFVSGLLQNFTFKSPSGGRIKFDVMPGLTLTTKDSWVIVVPR